MYEVSANINDVSLKKIPLNSDFQLNVNAILGNIISKTKLIFICSPNNPTANTIARTDIIKIIENFKGIVVIDEAYIDFSTERSFSLDLDKYPNIVVLQTFSKAWGLANLRLGIAYASTQIIEIFNKVKPPYNVNGLSQQLAIEALNNVEKKNKYVQDIIAEREKLVKELKKISFIEKIYPSDANFLLVKTPNGNLIYDKLIASKVIVRNRSNVPLCENCLRITVGTPEENKKLIDELLNIKL
jgi:histidinol-phosphate aminotransferase